MARDHMEYDKLVQGALRGVMRQILARVAKDGLPGDHHLYVVFDTNHPGAKLAPFLKEKYPEEMTIVLQHQFWGLKVEENQFTVFLSFNKEAQELIVPWAAVKGIFDPSVQFGLQFDVAEEDEESEEQMALEEALDAAATPADGAAQGPAPAEKPVPAVEEAEKPKAGEVVSLDSFRRK